jgi:lipoprotein-anchoring transpeptidase ErfK/SrfK
MKTPLGVKGVSHGCVRLADANARELFKKLPLGAVVVVQA